MMGLIMDGLGKTPDLRLFTLFLLNVPTALIYTFLSSISLSNLTDLRLDGGLWEMNPKNFLWRYIATLFVSIAIGILFYNNEGLELLFRIIFLMIFDVPLVFITFKIQNEFERWESKVPNRVIIKNQSATARPKPVFYLPAIGDLVRVLDETSFEKYLNEPEIFIVVDTGLIKTDQQYVTLSSIYGYGLTDVPLKNLKLVEKAVSGRADFQGVVDFILNNSEKMKATKLRIGS
jgi:hypothetical protein